jgi:hypothetical protein
MVVWIDWNWPMALGVQEFVWDAHSFHKDPCKTVQDWEGRIETFTEKEWER